VAARAAVRCRAREPLGPAALHARRAPGERSRPQLVESRARARLLLQAGRWHPALGLLRLAAEQPGALQLMAAECRHCPASRRLAALHWLRSASLHSTHSAERRSPAPGPARRRSVLQLMAAEGSGPAAHPLPARPATCRRPARRTHTSTSALQRRPEPLNANERVLPSTAAASHELGRTESEARPIRGRPRKIGYKPWRSRVSMAITISSFTLRTTRCQSARLVDVPGAPVR
jgi:hypothetical protein